MPQTTLPVDLVFGAGLWNNEPANIQTQRDMIQMLRKHNIKYLDTARHYAHGESEAFLGREGLSSQFQIITKAPSALVPKGSTRTGIVSNWNPSSTALRTEHVDMYLLHVPDDKIPISETMDGIQALYLAGHFTHFGLSNFSAAQVEECHMYATKMGYILPSTYQSIYSPLNRVPEATLFPLLRRLGISIQAYSCLGSGFLVRSPTDIQAGKGNFDHTTILGKVLQDMYGKDSYLNFLEGYGKLAEEAGLNRAGMAYRWVVWNSKLEVGKGDKVLLGASCPHQLDQTMIEIQKGPLEDWVVKRLGLLWESVQADAPEHNFATYKKLLKAGLL